MLILVSFILIAWFVSRKYHHFLQIFAILFATLLFMASNKSQFGISRSLTEATFSPLSLARWIMLSLFLFYSIYYFQKRRTTELNVPFVSLSLLLMIYIGASSIYAVLPKYSFLRGVSIAMLFGCLIFGVQTFFSDEQNSFDFLELMYKIAGIIILSGFALYVFRRDIAFGYAREVGRYAGITGNPIQLATFSALIVPIVMFHNFNSRNAILSWTLWGLMGFGLFLSNSRTGTMTFITVSIIYVLIVRPQARIPLILILIFSILLIGFSYTATAQVMNFFSREDASVSEAINSGRVDFWKNLMPYLWEKPILGYGFACSYMLSAYLGQTGRHFHNSYLEMFGDLGLIGLLLLIALLGYIALTAIRLLQTSRSEFEFQVDAVFVCCFIAGIMDAFTDSWMFSVGNNSSLMFWVPAAAIIARMSARTAISTYHKNGSPYASNQGSIVSSLGACPRYAHKGFVPVTPTRGYIPVTPTRGYIPVTPTRGYTTFPFSKSFHALSIENR